MAKKAIGVEGLTKVCGHDLARSLYPVKRQMGLVPEESNVYIEEPSALLPRVVDWARSRDLRIVSLSTLGPSLEDVFLEITGQEIGTVKRQEAGREDGNEGGMGRLLDEASQAWAMTVKDVCVYYFTPPMIMFGLMLPFFLFFSFSIKREIGAAVGTARMLALTIFFTALSAGPVIIPLERRIGDL